ncbi:MAG: hypothetical protein GDA48_00015 [Hormoscilla sp. GM102CHS1]|nr:hypothetical protein [Hormoscilla sp. GM102CHS1]
MAQARSRWRLYCRQLLRIYNQTIGFSPFQSAAQWRSLFFAQRSRRYKKLGKWLGLVTVVVAMLWWNGQLLLATTVGIAIMLLVYFLQQGDWQKRWSDLGKLFTGANRHLAVAVGSGGLATLGTYMACAVWIDSDSPWIAAGAILQGLGTLAIIILLVGQSLPGPRPTADLDRSIEQLTDIHPLRRLIAVRQLTREFTTTRWERDRRIIADCLALMLTRETEPAVKNAVLEGMQVMGKVEKIASQTAEISIPIDLKPDARAQTDSQMTDKSSSRGDDGTLASQYNLMKGK